MSPGSSSNWENEFIIYLSFKIEGWSVVSWVINDWISSQVAEKSDLKKSYILQLLKASWWSGVLKGICNK